MTSATENCALCKITICDPASHKTEWFYAGWEGMVVEDWDSGDADLRLLFIPAQHIIPTEEEHQHARRLLWGIACALEIQRGYTIGGYEIVESGHWHTKLKLYKERNK